MSWIGIGLWVVLSVVVLIISNAMGVDSAQSEVKGTADDFILRFPKNLLVIGAVVEIIGIAVLYFMEKTLFTGEDKTFGYIFTGILILGMLLVFAYICFKVNRSYIRVTGEKITVKPTFGAVYTDTFDNIATAVRKSSGSVQNVESLIVTFKSGKRFKAVSTMYSYQLLENRLSAPAVNITH